MRSDYTMTIKRAGIPQATSVPAQADPMTQHEAAYYGGAGPYFRYRAFFTTLARGGVLLGDLLVDQVNVDAITGANAQYRVINEPVFYPDGHTEAVVDHMVGT